MRKIVLADSSPTIRKVVELTLLDQEIEVLHFADGASALEQIRNQPVDLVLADVSLPELNGYELCRAIKNDPSKAHVPVVLLAGTLEVLDLDLAETVGACRNLTKPFETAQLFELVQDLSKAPTERSAAHSLKGPKVEPIRSAQNPIAISISRRPSQSPDLFELSLDQCRAASPTLEREIVWAPPVRPKRPSADWEGTPRPIETTEVSNVDLIVDRLLKRLPEELARFVAHHPELFYGSQGQVPKSDFDPG